MAKEYIERNELIDTLKRFAPEHYSTLINMLILKHPTSDMVEVVRCKDCKHYHEYLNCITKEPTGWGKCTDIAMDIDLTVNDFCSYGERKGNDENGNN